MPITAILTVQIARYSRRAVPCLLAGGGCVLATAASYGGPFVLPESGCYWGGLALLLLSERAQRAGRYPDALGAAMVAVLCCLVAAAFAGLIAIYTFAAPDEVGWPCGTAPRGCQAPPDAALAGLALAGGAVLAGIAAWYTARIGVAVWRAAPVMALGTRGHAPPVRMIRGCGDLV